MAVIGTAIGGLIGGFGKKPEVPDLPKIDPTKVQGDAIAGNLQNFGAASQLGAQVNEANQKQQLAMLAKALEFALPGGLGQAQSIVASQLRGEVPQDVQEGLLRSNAGKAFAGGFAGSGFSGALGLRDLGLTSLGIQQQGLQNFQGLAGMVPQSPLFDITSMFFTPQQRLDFAFNDRESQFNRNMLANQVAAAPDPFKAALTQAIIQDEAAIMEMVGNVVGMAGGAAGCWVARAVYGESNPKWRMFREWMFTKAPAELRNFYMRFGPSIAALVRKDKRARKNLRGLMDRIISQHTECYAR